MVSAVQRTLAILEKLAERPAGVMISELAVSLDVPLSATHRALAELVERGYARQAREQGPYLLTMRLVTVGLNFLSRSGVVDIAKSALDELAAASGELVRLAVVDNNSLVFVAKSQGASGALRYDPDMGLAVQLSCSAAGQAWLSTMPEHDALELVFKQGFGSVTEFGPNAPRNVRELLPMLEAARSRGFSTIVEQFAAGMTSMAAPVMRADGGVIGVVTIAGPMFRLTEDRMEELAAPLLHAARQISEGSMASAHFRER